MTIVGIVRRELRFLQLLRLRLRHRLWRLAKLPSLQLLAQNCDKQAGSQEQSFLRLQCPGRMSVVGHDPAD